MKKSVSDLDKLIKKMDPKLDQRKFYFASVSEEYLMNLANFLDHIKCIFREEEGLTIIFSEDVIENVNELTKKVSGPFAFISLGAFTDLTGDIGFLSNIDTKLAKSGISLNINSGYYHDHLFVPYEKAESAIKILNEMSSGR